MGKLFVVLFVAVAVLALGAYARADRNGFASCLEKRGAVVGDSTEFRQLAAFGGGSEKLAGELDRHSVSIRMPDSEGLALVAQSDSGARDAERTMAGFLNGYTTQRAGKVVVAWSLGPEEAASAAVYACAR